MGFRRSHDGASCMGMSEMQAGRAFPRMGGAIDCILTALCGGCPHFARRGSRRGACIGRGAAVGVLLGIGADRTGM